MYAKPPFEIPSRITVLCVYGLYAQVHIDEHGVAAPSKRCGGHSDRRVHVVSLPSLSDRTGQDLLRLPRFAVEANEEPFSSVPCHLCDSERLQETHVQAFALAIPLPNSRPLLLMRLPDSRNLISFQTQMVRAVFCLQCETSSAVVLRGGSLMECRYPKPSDDMSFIKNYPRIPLVRQ